MNGFGRCFLVVASWISVLLGNGILGREGEVRKHTFKSGSIASLCLFCGFNTPEEENEHKTRRRKMNTRLGGGK